MIPRTGLILLAASTIFAGLIAIELQTAPSEEPQIPAPPPKTEAEASATPQRPRPEQLAEIAKERPLFSPTRRPPEKAPPTTAGDPELSDVRLTGIVMENDHRIAIFAITGAKPLVRSKGEYVKEWK